MAYCTLADLKNQLDERVLVNLTDDAGEEIKMEKITSAIADADAEIDSYAQAQYAVPFNPVPEMIRKISVDIAVYNLFSKRGFDEEKEKMVISRYKNAVRFLENLAKGVVGFAKTEAPPPVATTIVSQPQVFNRDKLKGF
jgi:phage gp36-like protein